MGTPNKQMQKDLSRQRTRKEMHMYSFKYLELLVNSQKPRNAGDTGVYQKEKSPYLTVN